MATVVDTLQVLVEADARSLENVLKRVMQSTMGTINEINKQEINWTSIFSRAVSPAIISTIAALFAMAIQKSAMFQQAITDAGAAVGMNTSEIGVMGEEAKKMGSSLGVSSADAAKSLAQLSLIFGKNTQATYNVSEAIAQLSQAGFGDMNEMVANATQLFRAWGITTENEATAALTSLLHAAQATGLEIPSLVQEFLKFSPSLRAAGFGAESLNEIMSGFAATINQAGLTSAAEMFNALAESASKPAGPLIVLGVGMEEARRSLVQNGGIQALKDASEALERMGSAGPLVAESMGISKGAIQGFVSFSSQQLDELIAKQNAVATNALSIKDVYDDTETSLRKWQRTWETFKNLLTKSGVDVFFGKVADVVTVILKMLGELGSVVGGVLKKTFGDAVNTLAKVWEWLDKIFGIFSKMDKVGEAVKKAWTGFADAAKGGQVSLFSMLGNSLGGFGFNLGASALQRLGQKAEQSGVLDTLMSALGGNKSASTTIANTFNLTIPAGYPSLSPRDIAQQLYQKFQGY